MMRQLQSIDCIGRVGASLRSVRAKVPHWWDRLRKPRWETWTYLRLPSPALIWRRSRSRRSGN